MCNNNKNAVCCICKCKWKFVCREVRKYCRWRVDDWAGGAGGTSSQIISQLYSYSCNFTHTHSCKSNAHTHMHSCPANKPRFNINAHTHIHIFAKQLAVTSWRLMSATLRARNKRKNKYNKKPAHTSMYSSAISSTTSSNRIFV